MSSALSGPGDCAGVESSDDLMVDAEKVDDKLQELDWLSSEAIEASDDADDIREIVCLGYGEPGRVLPVCDAIVGFLRLMTGSCSGVVGSSHVGRLAGRV